MRDFAALLQLLRDLQEAIAFVSDALSVVQLELRSKRNEIILHHGDDQSARSNFGSGAGYGRSRGNSSIVRQSGHIDCLVHIALARVLVNGVVRDETNSAM